MSVSHSRELLSDALSRNALKVAIFTYFPSTGLFSSLTIISRGNPPGFTTYNVYTDP
jgi:hypothetical protein